MTDDFIPLCPRHPNGQPFQSLVATVAPAVKPVGAPPVVPPEPVVTLVRDGEKITHITIQCRCGEVIELACAY